MDDKFSRVLIYGETFCKLSGGGITLCNLFEGWPIDKLACIHGNAHLTDPEICQKYYRIGNQEFVSYWPHSLFQKNPESIADDFNVSSVNENEINSNNEFIIRRFVKSAFKSLVDVLGVGALLQRKVLSVKLKNWIIGYQPEILYCQVFSVNDIRLVEEIVRLTNIPLVIHIMDNFLEISNQKGPFKRKLDKILKKEFHQLLKKATRRIAISGAMKNEYEKLFSVKFEVFHNPIKITDWQPYFKSGNDLGDPIKFLYIGRVNTPTLYSVIEFSQFIDKLNQQGIASSFTIVSNNLSPIFLGATKNINKLVVGEQVDHKDIPKILKDYDFLVLCTDFDDFSFRYTRLSMSTKFSEYMISGVPIILFVPTNTAMAVYAQANKCAMVIDEHSRMNEVSILVNYILNARERKEIVSNAQLIAIRDFDSNIICKSFKDVLQSCRNI